MKDPEISLSPELLLRAYASGVFPMAESRDDPELFWVDPRRRGILPMDGFHISRSLGRRMRRAEYSAVLNSDFRGVVTACSDREETWINKEIFNLYSDLHDKGHAHSLEIYMDRSLAGGVYGVSIGGAFFGESMFSKRTDGSKLALAHLIDHLRLCGFVLFDTQFVTPHLLTLGAQEISRASYHLLLERALQITASVNAVDLDTSPQAVLQRMTQMS